jgi:hypothetical protein
MNGRSFFGLIVLSTAATLLVLWVLPPFGKFSVKAKVVN